MTDYINDGNCPECASTDKNCRACSESTETAGSVEVEIDAVTKFAAAYEKEKYKVMRSGGEIKSINCFMVDYCQKLRRQGV